ncbi:hypothetical protein VNO77_16779 [Canavalia gladiata]|uniref:Uncharacterized protein n=1 Tax=Canavalia gladiata TaxID=3824 RepID=A0AAN9QM16_CANGL
MKSRKPPNALLIQLLYSTYGFTLDFQVLLSILDVAAKLTWTNHSSVDSEAIRTHYNFYFILFHILRKQQKN